MTKNNKMKDRATLKNCRIWNFWVFDFNLPKLREIDPGPQNSANFKQFDKLFS